jgi:RNA polymerase sigma factor (sigma-70 family)
MRRDGVNSGNGECSVELMLSLWENFFRQVIFAQCHPLVEQATNFYRERSTEAELEDFKQEAMLHLWEFVEQNITVSSDFELKAKRAMSRQLKSVKRFSAKQTKTAHQLETLNDGLIQLPSNELEHQEMLSLMSQAFQNLEPVQARTLKQRHGLGDFEKKKVIEIAAVEQVSRQTVRNREREALSKLSRDKNLQSLVS